VDQKTKASCLFLNLLEDSKTPKKQSTALLLLAFPFLLGVASLPFREMEAKLKKKVLERSVARET
jgi:hypothetical protein